MIAACPLSYLVAAIVITVQLINRRFAADRSLRQPRAIAPMRRDLPARTRRIVRLALYAAGGLLLLGFLFLWSGVYSVAASRGHWAIMEWFLTFAMRNSVKTHAMLGIEAPPLDSPIWCGSAPGISTAAAPSATARRACRSARSRGSMLPPPPDLATQMRPWRDRELFWIVKNGIKYTGMPAWAAQQRDDEVWAVVAFLRRLPALDAAAAIASSRSASLQIAAAKRARARDQPKPHPRRSAPARAATAPSATARRARWCRSCMASRPSFSPPHCRPMRTGAAPAASCSRSPRDLDAERSRSRRALLRRAAAAAAASIASRMRRGGIERGRRSPSRATRARGFRPAPAATAQTRCKIYPRLAGQNAAYMANRLRLWKGGLAPGTDGEAIMAPIARALSERQIEDVAAYYAASPRPRRAADEAARRMLGCRDAGSPAARRPVRAGPQRPAAGRSRRSPGCCSRSARSCSRSSSPRHGSRSAARRGCARLLARARAVMALGLAFPAVTLTLLLGYGVWLMRAQRWRRREPTRSASR